MSGINLKALFPFVLLLCSSVVSFETDVNNSIAIRADEIHEIEVRRCQGSKVAVGDLITVPSYYFETDVALRIIDGNLSACSSEETLESADYYFIDKLSNKTLEDLYLTHYLPVIKKVSLLPIGFLAVNNHFYRPDEFCVMDFKQEQGIVTDLTLKYCRFDCFDEDSRKSKPPSSLTRPCISSCCPLGAVWDSKLRFCAPSGGRMWSGYFYNVTTWDWDPLGEIGLENDNELGFKPRYWYYRLGCKQNNDTTEMWHIGPIASDSDRGYTQPIKLMSDGTLRFISGRRRWDLLKDFCIGGIMNYGDDDDVFTPYTGDKDDQIVALCAKDNVGTQTITAQSELYMYCLFGASVFYFLTALFLGILWDSQNTHGWSVFAMSCSLFGMMVFVGNAHRLGIYGDYDIRNSTLCIVNGIFAHYFYLSSFIWLAIINYNVWSAFRVLKPRKEKKDFKELYYYLIIGFGCPLIVVAVGLILDHAYPHPDNLVITPEYGYNICFVAEHAQGVYIFYLLALPFSIVVVLFTHTAYKLYSFQQDTARVRSSSSAGDRKMFRLFAKLSIVLGISWIFEFLSWSLTRPESKQHWAWIIFDLFNLFSSIFVFFIFVCKKQTVTQLELKYPFMKPITEKMSRVWSSKQTSSNEPSGNTGSSNLQNGSKIDTNSVKTNGIENQS